MKNRAKLRLLSPGYTFLSSRLHPGDCGEKRSEHPGALGAGLIQTFSERSYALGFHQGTASNHHVP